MPEVISETKLVFDILKRDNQGTFHWLDAASDLARAEARLRQLCAGSSEQFVIFHQGDLRVVATYANREYKRF